MMLNHIYDLSRIRDYYHSVIFSTMGGMIVSGIYTLFIIPILTANIFYMAFSFAFNDSQDYQEDSKDGTKRNIVSKGKITKSKSLLVATFFLAISVILIIIAKPEFLLLYMPAIIFSFLYSWKMVRLKTKPVIDLFIHGFAFGGIFVLSGYFISNSFDKISISIFLAAFFASAAVEMLNEVRDFNSDKKNKFRTTAIVAGLENSRLIFFAFLFLSSIFTIISFVILLRPINFIFWFVVSITIMFYTFLSIRENRDLGKDVVAVFNKLKVSYIPPVFGLILYIAQSNAI